MADFEWMEGYDKFEHPDDWLDWLEEKANIDDFFGNIEFDEDLILEDKRSPHRDKILQKRYYLKKCQCGGNLILRIRHSLGKLFWGCSNFPNCRQSENIKVNQTIDTKCDLCDGVLLLKKGRFGFFFGCASYPKCKFTIDAPFKNDVRL